MDLQTKIDAAISKSIEYLSQHQFPNGEFAAYVAPDEAMQVWCIPDSGNYTTALISICLLPFQTQTLVDKMLNKSAGFLSYQMMRGGVWQHQTKWHKWFRYLAPDIDDTGLVSYFLKQRKVAFPDNTRLILSNRAKNGAFYTWFTFRWKSMFSYSQTYVKLVLRELKSPLKTQLFWIRNEHTRQDIDVIANANLIAYLRHSVHTDPAIRYIIDILEQDKEAGSDKWYFNPIVYYYFIARLSFLGIEPISGIRELLINKIKKAVHQSSRFTDCSMEMALATSSLLMLGYHDKNIDTYVEHILMRQQSNGEWERHAIYAGGPKLLIFWGSEELTTALCLEALHIYKEYKLKLIDF